MKKKLTLLITASLLIISRTVAMEMGLNQQLHVACKNGNYAEAAALIETGADVHSKDRYGNTPLHQVSQNVRFNVNVLGKDVRNYYKIAKMLLKKNVVIDAQNNFGWTPLGTAILDDASPCIVELLIKKGARLNLCRANSSLLGAATQHGRPALIPLLLTSGAPIPKNGFTPLHEACAQGTQSWLKMDENPVMQLLCTPRFSVKEPYSYTKKIKEVRLPSLNMFSQENEIDNTEDDVIIVHRKVKSIRPLQDLVLINMLSRNDIEIDDDLIPFMVENFQNRFDKCVTSSSRIQLSMVKRIIGHMLQQNSSRLNAIISLYCENQLKKAQQMLAVKEWRSNKTPLEWIESQNYGSFRGIPKLKAIIAAESFDKLDAPIKKKFQKMICKTLGLPDSLYKINEIEESLSDISLE